MMCRVALKGHEFPGSTDMWLPLDRAIMCVHSDVGPNRPGRTDIGANGNGSHRHRVEQSAAVGSLMLRKLYLPLAEVVGCLKAARTTSIQLPIVYFTDKLG